MSVQARVARRIGVLGATAAAALALAATAALAATTATSTKAAATPVCSAGQLAVWVNMHYQSALGTAFIPVEFTNVGTATCTLHGYPIVSVVNAKGQGLGAGASRVTTVAATTVTLAHGATATAVMHYSNTNVGNCPAKNRVTGYELKVSAPNQLKQPNYTYFGLGACTSGVSYLGVEAIVPGVQLNP